MTLVLIEVPDENAAKALVEQQNVRVIRIIPEGEAEETLLNVKRPANAKVVALAPRKWAGSIPAASAEAWDKHLQEIRGEWERDI